VFREETKRKTERGRERKREKERRSSQFLAVRCRQIIIRIFMRRSGQEGGTTGRVQSNQLHACSLIRETARHDDQKLRLGSEA
jgi:hypothetical protein